MRSDSRISRVSALSLEKREALGGDRTPMGRDCTGVEGAGHIHTHGNKGIGRIKRHISHAHQNEQQQGYDASSIRDIHTPSGVEKGTHTRQWTKRQRQPYPFRTGNQLWQGAGHAGNEVFACDPRRGGRPCAHHESTHSRTKQRVVRLSQLKTRYR